MSSSQHESPPLTPSTAPPPPGLGVHPMVFREPSGLRTVGLLIPLPVIEQLAIEEAQRIEQAVIEQEERLRVVRVKQVAESEADAADAELKAAAVRPGPVARRGPPPPPTIPEVLPEQPPNTVAVFEWTAAVERFNSFTSTPATADKDMIRRDQQLFAKAMTNGPWRLITPPQDWEHTLPQLACDMPNFAPVVEFIQQRLALAKLSGAPLQPPPILLLGEPGVGKTHFTQRLAEALCTTIHRQSFDNAQSNSALRGSERHWSNTSVGALWELIVGGTRANPVILLDEIDKGTRGSGHYRPVDALLTLLEPVTASCVKDQSMDFEFDASYAWYIATGNDPAAMSAPVRSRFTEFTIGEPDIEGRLVLANSIYASTLARTVPSLEVRVRFKSPTNLQIARLAWLTPREIRMACERALGVAAFARRWHHEDTDFQGLPSGPSKPQSAPVKPPEGGNDGDDIAVFVVRSR